MRDVWKPEVSRKCLVIATSRAGGGGERGTCHCKDIRSGNAIQKLTKGCTASWQHNNNKGSKKEGSVGVVTAGAWAGAGAVARAPSRGGREVSQQLLLMLPLPTYVLPKCCHKFWGAATTTRHKQGDRERDEEEGEREADKVQRNNVQCQTAAQQRKWVRLSGQDGSHKTSRERQRKKGAEKREEEAT